MEVAITDTAAKKAFRYHSKERMRHVVKQRGLKESDKLPSGKYKIVDRKADGFPVALIVDYNEERDRAVVVTQKSDNHEHDF